MKIISSAQDFERMIEDGAYKFGDMLEFSSDGDNWEGPFKLIWLGVDKDTPLPFCADNGVCYQHVKLQQPELELNDPIFLWVDLPPWFKGQFCEFSGDGVLVYSDGKTSWTSTTNPEVKIWPRWRIPTEDELRICGPHWYKGRK